MLPAANGAACLESNGVIILSSTIKFSLSTRLALSITCLRASVLFTNQDCLGSFKIPYFSLADKFGSGTILPASSYPIKLNLVIGLLDYDDFSNEEKIIDLDELEQAREDLLSSQDESPLSNYFRNMIVEAASSPEKSIYRAQVIQWGDEETLLEKKLS